jgi:PPOX class probable F420-dependent enzyme
MLNPDVRRVLDGTSLGHLATVLPDGSPHTTPVFVGTHDDQLIFFTGPRSRKARNLRRDPRLALSLAPADNPFQPVIIRGRVTELARGRSRLGDHRPDRDEVHRPALYPRRGTHRRRRRARPADHRYRLNRPA